MTKRASPPDLTQLGLTQFAPYLMNRIMRRYNQRLQTAIAPLGLSVPKMRALAALAAYGELSANALAVYAVAEQSTMSRTVDQLERDGLIQRNISQDDNRVRVMSLTPDGRAAYDAVWPIMRAEEAAMLDALDPETRDAFVKALNTILEKVRVNHF